MKSKQSSKALALSLTLIMLISAFATSFANPSPNPPVYKTGKLAVNKEATLNPDNQNQWDITLDIDVQNRPEKTRVVLVMDESGSMEYGPNGQKEDSSGTKWDEKDTRLGKAKVSAKSFVEALLAKNSNSKNIEVALVPYGSVLDYENIKGFTKATEKDQLIEKIDGLKALSHKEPYYGATYTQVAIRKAWEMLDTADRDEYDNNIIVLITDGLPSRSAGLKKFDDTNSYILSNTELENLKTASANYYYRPDNKSDVVFADPLEPTNEELKAVMNYNWTSSKTFASLDSNAQVRVVKSDFASADLDSIISDIDVENPNTYGTGIDAKQYFQRIGQEKEPTVNVLELINLDNMTILEANIAKKKGNEIFSVGIGFSEGNEEQSRVIHGMASGDYGTEENDKHTVVTDAEHLSNYFEHIANNIIYAIENPTITDPMGQDVVVVGTPERSVTISSANGYNLLTGDKIGGGENDANMKLFEVEWDSATNTYRFTAKDKRISEAIAPITIKYTVEAASGKHLDNELFPTNGETKITHDDGEELFPVPEVDQKFTTIKEHFVLVDDDGNLLNPTDKSKAINRNDAEINAKYYEENGSKLLPAGSYDVVPPAIITANDKVYQRVDITSANGTGKEHQYPIDAVTDGKTTVNTGDSNQTSAPKTDDSKHVYYAYKEETGLVVAVNDKSEDLQGKKQSGEVIFHSNNDSLKLDGTLSFSNDGNNFATAKEIPALDKDGNVIGKYFIKDRTNTGGNAQQDDITQAIDFVPNKDFVGMPKPLTIKYTDANGLAVQTTYQPKVFPVKPTGIDLTSVDYMNKNQSARLAFTAGHVDMPIVKTEVNGKKPYTFKAKPNATTMAAIAVDSKNPSTTPNGEVAGHFEINQDTGIVIFVPKKNYVGGIKKIEIVAKDTNGTEAIDTYEPEVVNDDIIPQDAVSIDIQGAVQTGKPEFKDKNGNKVSTGTLTLLTPDGTPTEDGENYTDVDGNRYTLNPNGEITFTPAKDYTGSPDGVKVKYVDNNNSNANGTANNEAIAEYHPAVIPAGPIGHTVKTVNKINKLQASNDDSSDNKKPLFEALEVEVPVLSSTSTTGAAIETEPKSVPLNYDSLGFIDENDTVVKDKDGNPVKTLEVAAGTYTIKDNGVVEFMPNPDFVGIPETAKLRIADANGTTADAEYQPLVLDKVKIGTVTAVYVDEDGNELATPISTTDTVGEEYTTQPKTIPGYKLKAVPTNAKGKVIEGVTTVTYIYVKDNPVIPIPVPIPDPEPQPEPEPVEKSTVVVKHIVKDEDGNVVSETEETITGDVGTDYQTEPDPSKGTLVDTKGNPSGTFTKDEQEVVYTYVKEKDGVVIVKHIVKNDDGEVISETKEKLTGTIGTDYETKPDPSKGELIAITGDDEKGKFTKKDKEVTYIYLDNIGEVIADYVYLNENGDRIALKESQTIIKAIGDSYQTEKINKIGDYVLVKIEGEEKGTITSAIKHVTYIYIKQEKNDSIPNDDEDEDDEDSDDDSDDDEDNEPRTKAPAKQVETEPKQSVTETEAVTTTETEEQTTEVETPATSVIPAQPELMKINNPNDLPLPEGRVFEVVDDSGRHIANVKIDDDGSYIIVDNSITPLGKIKINKDGTAELIEIVNLDIPLAVNQLPKTNENSPNLFYLLGLVSILAGFAITRKY